MPGKQHGVIEEQILDREQNGVCGEKLEAPVVAHPYGDTEPAGPGESEYGFCFEVIIIMFDYEIMTNDSERLTYIGPPSRGRGDSTTRVSLKHSVVSLELCHFECP